MRISYKGHGLTVTPALKELTDQKLNKLQRHSDKISSIEVVFDVQKIQQIAEASMIIEGYKIHAKSSSDDMYKAIDMMTRKLASQLEKHKQKTSDH